MGVAVDRLSALPDSLLSFILSKVPIRDAIKCSRLSKRWRFLYTQIPKLVLSPYLLVPNPLLLATIHVLPLIPDPLSIATVEDRVSRILRLHSSDLKEFFLDIFGPWASRFRHQSICEWMRCVARKNVECLVLKYSSLRETPPPALFSCTRLTKLTLRCFIFITIPTDFAGFKHLVHCTFIDMKMTNDSLAGFISQCPLLQSFKLLRCDGLQRPVISALNITDLSIGDRSELGLTVNCPNLQTLQTTTKELTVNGMAFHDLSPTISRLKMELGSNLIELFLQSSVFLPDADFSRTRFLEIIGTLRSLKVFSIDLGLKFPRRRRKRIAVPLFNLLTRLPNLERFHLCGELELEEAEGDPMAAPFTYSLPNLRFAEIQINKYDDRELAMLCSFLQIAPALKEVKLQPAPKIRPPHGRCNSLGCQDERYNSILQKWEAWKEGDKQGKNTASISEFSFYF